MDMNLVKFDALLSELKQDKSLENNLSIIIRDIELEFKFRSLGIFLRNAKEGLYRLKISRHISHTFSKKTTFPDSDSFIQDLTGCQNKHFYDPLKIKFEYDYSHLVIIPLHNNKELFGFLFMDRQEGHFSPEEVTKLNIFASIISLGVNLNDLRAMLEHTKVIDDVTKLYTYQSFSERAAFMFSLMKRHHKSLVMAVFKVNNFGDLVRMYGKHKINEAAQKVGTILDESIRKSDLMGKIFKDTIAIFMAETTVSGAKKVISRIDEQIMQLDVMKDQKLGWGIAEMTDSVKDVHQLLHNAEEAAFEANRQYDDNIVVYRED